MTDKKESHPRDIPKSKTKGSSEQNPDQNNQIHKEALGRNTNRKR